VQTTFN